MKKTEFKELFFENIKDFFEKPPINEGDITKDDVRATIRTIKWYLENHSKLPEKYKGDVEVSSLANLIFRLDYWVLDGVLDKIKRG